MKVIPQTRHSHYISHLRFYFYFTMSVPDEGYSTNTSFALHYISSFLFVFYYERTWWRLFHKHVIRTTLYIFVSIFILLWAYLMKVIPQTRHSHYISYLRFYFYCTMSVPEEGYSTNTLFAQHYNDMFGVSPPNKSGGGYSAEKLLKLAINTNNQTQLILPGPLRIKWFAYILLWDKECVLSFTFLSLRPNKF